MKHGYKVQTVLERGDERSTWKGRGWVGVGSNPGRSLFFFFFFFFYWRKNAGIVRLGMCERVISKNWTCRETLQGGLPSNFIVTLEGSLTEFLVAVTFRIGTQIESFFFFFLFFKWLFWVVLNILSTNELKKKKSCVFLGFDPGASESGVRRSTNWATRAKLTGH